MTDAHTVKAHSSRSPFWGLMPLVASHPTHISQSSTWQYALQSDFWQSIDSIITGIEGDDLL